MISWGIADAEQLAALARLLDEYSKEMGIAGDKPARNRLAARIMCLFNEGITNPGDIRRNLDSSPSSWLAEQPLPDGFPADTASDVALKPEKSAA
jgi:hypothetical protein